VGLPAHDRLCRLLLRNCAVEQLAGFAIDEGEAEIGGPLTQTANDALAMLGVVRGGSRITVDPAILECAVDEDRELGAVAVIALALPTRKAKRR
jgi:hypothetical protein